MVPPTYLCPEIITSTQRNVWDTNWAFAFSEKVGGTSVSLWFTLLSPWSNYSASHFLHFGRPPHNKSCHVIRRAHCRPCSLLPRTLNLIPTAITSADSTAKRPLRTHTSTSKHHAATKMGPLPTRSASRKTKAADERLDVHRPRSGYESLENEELRDLLLKKRPSEAEVMTAMNMSPQDFEDVARDIRVFLRLRRRLPCKTDILDEHEDHEGEVLCSVDQFPMFWHLAPSVQTDLDISPIYGKLRLSHPEHV